MKNLSIFAILIVSVTMISCSSGKNNFGCGYSNAEKETKDCRTNKTTYIKKDITTINCAT